MGVNTIQCVCVCLHSKCVDLGASVIDHIHSNISHLSGLSGQRVRYSEENTVNIARTTLTYHNLLLRGKLQGLTSKSKVHCRNQNVSRMPYKNHWTPHSCDEEKQGRLQSQHNFLSFFRKKAHLQVLPFCC